MKTVHISLGNDCVVAAYLRDHGLRSHAYPFDWAVTYGGVSGILAQSESRALASWCSVDAEGYNAAHGSLHLHMPFPLALPTMARRLERLRQTLADPGINVVLIRRSHTLHHHFERGDALVDELADARALARALASAHPDKAAAGGFRIELMLACDQCHPRQAPGVDGLLRVHNLTRGPSMSFAENFQTKTYTDAMHTCLATLGIVGQTPDVAPGMEQGPYALEQ